MTWSEQFARLDYHLENSPLGVVEWDAQFRLLRWSARAQELFGWSEAELRGLPTGQWRFVHPDDEDAVNATMRELMEGGAVRNISRNRNFTKDGRVLHCVWYNSVRAASGDTPASYLSLIQDVTEQVRVSEALSEALQREREARNSAEADRALFRSLFESAPGAYVVLSPDGYLVVAASEAYLAATRTRRGDIVGRRLFEVLASPPEDSEGTSKLRASLRWVESQRQSDPLGVQRFVLPRPDAEGGGFEERWWSVVNSPVFAPDGRLSYLIHRIEDLTEYLREKRERGEEAEARVDLESRSDLLEVDIVMRNFELRRANERLDRSQALLRMASQVSKMGAWAVELPGQQMIWSDEVREMHEVAPSFEPSFENAYTFYAPETRALLRATFQACLEQGQAYDLEVELFGARGGRRWVRYVGERVVEDGVPVRIQGAMHDVTSRKRLELEHRQAEQALRVSEERFRLLSKATNDAVWDWDLVTDDLWWNDGFESLFGFARDEIEPGITSWTNRVHPDEREQVVAEVHRAIESGQTQWSGQYRFLRKDGSYAHVLDRGYVIRDGTGKAVRMVGGMADLSDRIALETQMRQVQRMESIGQLTGGIAHDFNNLLTVIQGNAELLVELVQDQPQLAELASMIDSASQRGSELTHRLLAFARKQALDPRPIDLNQLLRGMDGLLRRTLGEHIEIRFVPAAGLWPTSVDPGQLENAVLNLAINARDAMAKGGRLVIATANTEVDETEAARHPGLASGSYVTLEVSDTGCGIPPEILTRVFEPFFTTKGRDKGTGLGLAMVYGFIKQSQGYTVIESEPGRGTTVRLYLPRVVGDVDIEPTKSAREPEIAASATILLVEDDALIRIYARDQLAAMGYTVFEAENGPQALRIMQSRNDIDLLFTDMVMPGGMTGYQLALAARELRPGLRVLYTSGYTEDALNHPERLQSGGQLLSKPYRRADLARKIREALA